MYMLKYLYAIYYLRNEIKFMKLMNFDVAHLDNVDVLVTKSYSLVQIIKVFSVSTKILPNVFIFGKNDLWFIDSKTNLGVNL